MKKKLLLMILGIAMVGLIVAGCGSQSGDIVKQSDDTNKLRSISISPSSVSLPIENTYQFIAIGCASGSTLAPVTPSWEVIGEIGTVSTSGFFTATKVGLGKIIGKYGSIEGFAIVEVTEKSPTGKQTTEPDTTLPDTPQNLSGMGYGSMVCLQWNPVFAKDLSGYRIYRSSSEAGDYIEIGQTSGTSYYDGKVEFGKVYYYKIKAIDAASNISEFSSAFRIENNNTNAPLPPQGLSNNASETSVDLLWDKNNESDLLGYNIYRRDENDADLYHKVNGSIIASNNFTDTNVIRGCLYYYVVTAVNTSNKESYYSNSTIAKTVPLGIENNPPQIVLSASNMGISPNGDGIRDNTQIDYEITDDFSEKAKNINIGIYKGLQTKTILRSVNEKDTRDFPIKGSFTWDGTDDNGVKFSDGDCNVGINLCDNTNLYASGGIDIFVDTSNPLVEEISQNLYAFSPNGDGKYDTLDVVFMASEGGVATIVMKNVAQEALATVDVDVKARKEYKATIHGDRIALLKRDLYTGAFVQDKEIFLSQNLIDGTYSFNVFVADAGGNKSETKISTFGADMTPPNVVVLSAAPNPFSPNGDGIEDTTAFSWVLSEPANVNLNIMKSDGALFQHHEGSTSNFVYPTTISNYNGQGAGDWEWDGRGSRNELLGGEYSYCINMEDRVGNVSSSETKTISLVYSPSLGCYLFMRPDPFSPINPDNNFTEIKYQLSVNNSIVKIYVKGVTSDSDPNNDVVKLVTNNEIQNAGEHSVRWYGDYEAGYSGYKSYVDSTKVSDGSYGIALEINPDSAHPAIYTNTVLIDTVPPHIITRPVQIDSVSKKATLTYSIPENSSIEVTVQNSSDGLVANAFTASVQSVGEHTCQWFGSESGVQYHFKVVAVDRALNRAEAVTESFSF